MNDLNNKRTHFTQLASTGELDEMLELESKRKVAQKKENLYPDFSSVIAWLKYLELDSALFEQRLHRHDIADKAAKIKPEVIQKTIKLVQEDNADFIKLLDEVTIYLGEEDSVTSADLILVFGSGDEGRIEKGVELWKQGVSDRIVISGGKPNYGKEELPEALKFARYALDLGVPKENILVEPNSIQIRDNIKATLNMLDIYGVDYSKNGIVGVAAWFVMRRIYLDLLRWTPMDTKIYRVNTVIDSGRLASNRWFDNELGINVIFNEFVKMNISFNTHDNE